MLNAARRAIERLGSDTEEAFAQSTDQQWVLFSQIVIIGEAANRVSKEDQASINEVPWPAIISMRNRVVHGYDSIDWNIVYQTVLSELPKLVTILERELSRRPQP